MFLGAEAGCSCIKYPLNHHLFENGMTICLISICFGQTLEEIRLMTATFHRRLTSRRKCSAAFIIGTCTRQQISVEGFKHSPRERPGHSANEDLRGVTVHSGMMSPA